MTVPCSCDNASKSNLTAQENMLIFGVPRKFICQLLVFCAVFVIYVDLALAQSMELKTSSSENLAAFIEELRDQTSKIEKATEQSIEAGILDNSDSELVFNEMIDRMIEVHRSISRDSEFYRSISEQEKSLLELQASLDADSSLQGDSRYLNLQQFIEQERMEVAEMKARLDDSILELERGISELESLKLFLSYQIRLSQFSQAVDTMESALVVSRESIKNINAIADNLSAINAITN